MCAHPALSVRTQSLVCAVWPRARGVVTLTLERTPEPGGGWPRVSVVCVRLCPSSRVVSACVLSPELGVRLTVSRV